MQVLGCNDTKNDPLGCSIAEAKAVAEAEARAKAQTTVTHIDSMWPVSWLRDLMAVTRGIFLSAILLNGKSILMKIYSKSFAMVIITSNRESKSDLCRFFVFWTKLPCLISVVF